MDIFKRKNKVGLTIALVLLLAPDFVFGTAQVADVLIYEGKKQLLFSTPLEDYFSIEHPRPDWLTSTTTACWRGYSCVWEVKDDQLFLTQINRDEYKESAEGGKRVATDITKKIFPNNSAPLLADWFSDVIRVPMGKELRYVHMGFASIYEQDVYLFFDKGRLIGKRIVQNDPAANQSDSDLAWREIGKITKGGGVKTTLPEVDVKKDRGDWMDGADMTDEQMDVLRKSEEPFRFRAIYFPKRLWIPPTPDSQALSFLFSADKSVEFPAIGSPIEVRAKFIAGWNLEIAEARSLPPGEAIQKKRSKQAVSPKP